ITVATSKTCSGWMCCEAMSATKKIYLEDDWSLTEGEESLEATVKAIQTRAEASARAASGPGTINTRKPEAVDDFLRNFLIQAGMTETLDCFQAEWTEMLHKGLVDAEQVGVVPEVYTDNQRLENQLKNAEREREEYRRAASAAAKTLDKARKARDFYRLQHKHVVQERNRLIGDIRKLKVQCDSYKPAVKRMTEKYLTVLKQIAAVSLERDKALEQCSITFLCRARTRGESYFVLKRFMMKLYQIH
uniref:Sperm associated antigen 16 n=1 Tax=Echeneis naucrates TaxID=173247 RepID=A0A665W2P6_ECHNA